MGFNYLDMLYGFLISLPVFFLFLNSMIKFSKQLKEKSEKDEVKRKKLKSVFIKRVVPVAIFIYILTQVLHIEGFIGMIFAFFLVEKTIASQK